MTREQSAVNLSPRARDGAMGDEGQFGRAQRALPSARLGPTAQARPGHVGVDLIESDLDMSPADPPAPGNIVTVMGTVAEPGPQCAFEPFDLFRPGCRAGT